MVVTRIVWSVNPKIVTFWLFTESLPTPRLYEEYVLIHYTILHFYRFEIFQNKKLDKTKDIKGIHCWSSGLGLRALTSEGADSNPGHGTKISQIMWHGQTTPQNNNNNKKNKDINPNKKFKK